jgi:membrane associated rhomboid family serine protease
VFPLKDNIPTLHFPLVTVLLIVVNVAVFGYQLTLSTDEASSPELARAGVSERDQLSIEYGAIPFRITHPDEKCGVARSGGDPEVVCAGNEEQGAPATEEIPDDLDPAAWWLTLITSMFLHGVFLHLGGNMLFLWVFGNNIEDSMGRGRFLAFYLLAGIVAVYTQALLDTSSTVPTIGASGAVAGVLGGYILLHPKARVLTFVLIVFFFTFIEIPAMILLAIWFALQFIPAFGQIATNELAEGGGVAYFAHVGGFLFGLAMIHLFATSDRRRAIANRTDTAY